MQLEPKLRRSAPHGLLRGDRDASSKNSQKHQVQREVDPVRNNVTTSLEPLRITCPHLCICLQKMQDGVQNFFRESEELMLQCAKRFYFSWR